MVSKPKKVAAVFNKANKKEASESCEAPAQIRLDFGKLRGSCPEPTSFFLNHIRFSQWN